MTISVSVNVEVEGVALSDDAVTRLISTVMEQERPGADGAVTLVFTDDDTVRELNRDYRGIDAATDVLSFGMSDQGGNDESEAAVSFVLPPGAGEPLGDIVISVETALRQAAEHGRTPEHELAHLIVHGALHLLGHDHAEPDEEALMRSCEDATLQACGFPPGTAGWSQ